MQSVITGTAFVLGDDIDTDQIIPAEYLSYNPAIPEERKYFGMYAGSGIPIAQSGLPDGNIPFVDAGKFTSDFQIVIGGKNFGCGSSREHAPLALAQAGIVAVVAPFYARIFYRNCVNGGYCLPIESVESLIDVVATGDTVSIDMDAAELTHAPTGKTYTLKPLGDAKPIIDAGGVFAYAQQAGFLPPRE